MIRGITYFSTLSSPYALEYTKRYTKLAMQLKLYEKVNPCLIVVLLRTIPELKYAIISAAAKQAELM
jgi:2-hydroxychromene-2-carboxylate isomerase